MLRKMRREWKVLLAWACCLVLVLTVVHEAYRALVYGIVRPVPGLGSLYRIYCKLAADMSCLDVPLSGISWRAHPVLFVVNLGVLVPAMSVLAALVALMLWGWKTEQRNLDRRASRPPMETAIREPMKR